MINPNMTKKSRHNLGKLASLGILAAALVVSFGQTAHADWDDHRGGHPPGREGGREDGRREDGRREDGRREDHHFRGYEDRGWHAGRWIRGDHDGRHGWWWIVDGRWYSYPQPVYPYPVNPYAPPVVYAPPVYAAPPPPPPPGINLIIPLKIR